MDRTIAIVAAAVMLAGLLGGALWAAEDPKPVEPEAKAGPIRVAILVGGHGYDKKNFDKAWSGHDDIACEVYKDARKPFTLFDNVGEFKYDVILMYTLMSGMTDQQKENMLALLKKGVGLVMWHHSLANWQDWPEADQLVGGKYWIGRRKRGDKVMPSSGFREGLDLKMHIEDADHPITKGMKDFEIHDEVYNRQWFAKDIHVLVTCDHPASDKPIAWIPKTPGMRVFAYQGGHDAKAWVNPGQRRLLAQGIRWVAGRIGDQAATQPAAAK